jgi:hypothetical protein
MVVPSAPDLGGGALTVFSDPRLGSWKPDADWAVWGMTGSTAGRLARDRSGELRWK